MPLKNGKTTALIQQIILGSSVPVGTIQAFGGASIPSGWLICDGSIVSRSVYSNLFLVLGVSHGSGDGETTFHLPDLRGRFLRGADNMGTGAAGRDTDANSRTAGNAGGNVGNQVGTIQNDAYKQHNHSASTTTSITHNAVVRRQVSNAAAGSGGSAFDPAVITASSTTTISNSGQNENRPINAAVLYIIKV